MPDTWNPGDQVVLKSGSPTMTIAKEVFTGDAGNSYQCDWFDGYKHLNAVFPATSLETEE